MRKIAYILSFVMLPLVAMAGDIKYTRPVLTLKNDTLTVEFSMSVEDVRVNSEQTYIIRKSKFPQNPKRSVRFSGKRTKRSVQKRKARNTQKAETKVL